MKVIETLWFTNRDGCIGIVVIEEDVTGDRKAYIGPVPGADEKADTESILAWGNKFSLDAAQRIEHYLTKGAGIPLSAASGLLEILELSNGKGVFIDGKEFTTDEAHEIIIKLTETWGTHFEKQELRDAALGLKRDC